MNTRIIIKLLTLITAVFVFVLAISSCARAPSFDDEYNWGVVKVVFGDKRTVSCYIMGFENWNGKYKYRDNYTKIEVTRNDGGIDWANDEGSDMVEIWSLEIKNNKVVGIKVDAPWWMPSVSKIILS